MTDTRAPVAPEPESTTDLLRRTAGGDQAGWAELVRRYTPLLHSRMRPYRLQQADQLDVIQTVWLRLATHIHRIHTPEHLGGWLATVVARECQGLARRGGRVALPGEVIELTAPTTEPGPEARAVDEDVARRLWGAVAELPAPRRELIRILFSDETRSYADISSATGVPVGSIGPTRGRALRQLRGLLADRALT
jgi:RNA polymerase sigma factor (sigma-70 family)